MSNHYRLKLDLHPGQLQVYTNRRRFNVVRCGRRWGKTVLAMAILAERAAQGLPTAYMAPTYKMLMDFWRECKRTLAPLIESTNEQEKRIDLKIPGGSIDFWSLDNPDALRGRKYAEVCIDEAAAVGDLEESWNMVIRPTLMDYKGGAWLFSTPKGRNYFWVLNEQARVDEQWATFHMPTASNPYIDDAEVEAFRQSMPTISYNQEILAEFVDVSGALMKREYLFYTDRIPDGLRVGMGVDLAISRSEDADYTAIVVVGYDEETGHRYVLDVHRDRLQFHQILKVIEALASKWQPHRINVEQVQFQAAVVQELMRKTNLPIKGFKPDRDKVTRFYPLLARYEQGLVYHMRGLLSEFEHELLAFGMKSTDHDDMVDALVMAHEAATAKARAGVVII